MDLQYQIGTEVVAVKCELRDGVYHITMDDRTYDVQLEHTRSAEVAFTVEGARHGWVDELGEQPGPDHRSWRVEPPR